MVESVAKVIQAADEAKEAKTRHEISILHDRVLLYRMNQRRLPESLSELLGGDRPLLDELTPDPWGSDYLVRPDENQRHGFIVMSKGPDRTEGTVDDLRSDDDR